MAGEQYLIGNIPTHRLEEDAVECRNVVSKGINENSTIDDFLKYQVSYDELRAIENELNLRSQGKHGITELGKIVYDDYHNIIGILDSNGLHCVADVNVR